MGKEGDLATRAVVLQRAGDWDAAADLYAEMFRQAARARDLARLVEALRGESQTRCWQEQYDLAAEIAELRWEIAERNHLPQEVARAMNMTAVIRHCTGNLKGARDLYEQALERARQVRDDELVGLICHNLGAIANVQGDLRAARSFYLESIGAAVRSGNQASSTMAYNNLGIVCGHLHDWMEAEIYFSRGIEIAEQLGDVALLAKLYTNRAESLADHGDLSRAWEMLDQAESIAARIEDRKCLADVEQLRGVIARCRGNLSAANQHLARSLLLAAKAGATLERAETLEELARLRWEEGKSAEAYSALREARLGFLSLGATRDVARVEALLADWETADLLTDWKPLERDM